MNSAIPKKINIVVKCIAASLVLFMLGVSIMILIPLAFPLHADGGVCWHCFDWGHGFRECGMDYNGTTGCTHAHGYCELTGVACNQPPAY